MVLGMWLFFFKLIIRIIDKGNKWQGTAIQDEVDLMKGYLACGWLLPAAIITPYVIYKQVTGYYTTLEKCVEALVVFDRSIIFFTTLPVS